MPVWGRGYPLLGGEIKGVPIYVIPYVTHYALRDAPSDSIAIDMGRVTRYVSYDGPPEHATGLGPWKEIKMEVMNKITIEPI